MSNQIDAKIKAKVEQFAQELTGLIHESAMAAVQQAIAGVMGAPVKRGPGRPAGSGAKKTAAKAGKKAGKKAAKKAGKRAAKKGGKSAAANPALGKAVIDTLSAKPGLSISEIASAVGVSKVDVQPTVVALLGEKKIRKTGERRGTKYFAK
jgi:hypothetical protein